MTTSPDRITAANRRTFLGQSLTGLGSVALASLLKPELLSAATPGDAKWPGVVQPLHRPQKAKRVIHLCMAGGPSHLETLDYKPKLAEMNGEPMPESITQGQPIAQLQGQKLKILAPQHEFAQYGESGQSICARFPKIGSVADELCIIRSLKTDAINHDPAHTFMNTGSLISGRPSMGSWCWYGLGADALDLPGFVVLTSTGKSGQMQPIASRQWHSGFLPSKFQGVRFYSKGDAVHYIDNPAGVTSERQRDVIDAIDSLNRLLDERIADPEIATRINQYELAFRMQTSVPELMDLSSEPQHILDMYGAQQGDGSFGTNCLLARRLAERGVRFIQLYHRDWDHHGGVKGGIEQIAPEVDGPCAALISDLKQRGMLDETLVIWGGEFGRTPMAQGSGRDHHQKGFSIWMAGGGIQGGVSYGNTDEFGYHAVENVVTVHDLHATMLHLMGVDHLRLTYKFQGRDFRLTDISGDVIQPILS
ncbi:MAG: sulfatase [Planctomycetales bacterium 12-60-4]|nr:MAG: sulfatase [Planctomycetales bacterium 12-60-4]